MLTEQYDPLRSSSFNYDWCFSENSISQFRTVSAELAVNIEFMNARSFVPVEPQRKFWNRGMTTTEIYLLVENKMKFHFGYIQQKRPL